jgi:hypothetical protein
MITQNDIQIYKSEQQIIRQMYDTIERITLSVALIFFVVFC